MMNFSACAAMTLTTMSVLAVIPAGTATAAPTCAIGSIPSGPDSATCQVGSAQDAFNKLQGLGYTVIINGHENMTCALSQCRVTNISPSDPGDTPAGPGAPTMYLDLDCPPSNN